MAFSSIDKRRNNPVLSIAFSLLSGFLIALAALVARGLILDKLSLEILISPLALAAGLLAIAGFLSMQFAFRTWHISAVVPLVTGIVVIFSNFLAFYLLSEPITTPQIAAMVMIFAGTLILSAVNVVKRG
ncbi:MAG: hypothetical protein HYW25_05190 [Candidatus Aenigmarchaeota archaeon]|nr:hypothetical protein [Candidatus Aenigmarchaeota archaeon]